MISLTPLEPGDIATEEDFDDVQYYLRRADEESVAAIRATDRRVHDSHAGMAISYSRKSLEMIARLDGTAR